MDRIAAEKAAQDWLEATARLAGPHGVSAEQESLMRLGYQHGYLAALAAAPAPEGQAVGVLIRPMMGTNAATRIIPNEDSLRLPPGEYPLYTHAPKPQAEAWILRTGHGTAVHIGPEPPKCEMPELWKFCGNVTFAPKPQAEAQASINPPEIYSKYIGGAQAGGAVDADLLTELVDALQVVSGCSPTTRKLDAMRDDKEISLSFVPADLQQIRRAIARGRAALAAAPAGGAVTELIEAGKELAAAQTQYDASDEASDSVLTRLGAARIRFSAALAAAPQEEPQEEPKP